MLTWHSAGHVPVTCLRGGFSPSQGGGGGGQISSGQWDILRVISRHVFANKVRFWGQMGPIVTPTGPGVSCSANLGQFRDNLASWRILALDI